MLVVVSGYVFHGGSPQHNLSQILAIRCARCYNKGIIFGIDHWDAKALDSESIAPYIESF